MGEGRSWGGPGRTIPTWRWRGWLDEREGVRARIVQGEGEGLESESMQTTVVVDASDVEALG